jgi:alanine racemase
MRPTWAEIDLNNLSANFHAVRRVVGDAVKIMAVVKADAYGHGAVRCARRLALEGAAWFGVALPEEGLQLRDGGIEKPILSLGGFWHGEENLIIERRITPIIFRVDAAESLNRAARAAQKIVDVHIEIDTGMNRLGVRFDAVAEFADKLKTFENLRVDGLMTHFAAADDAAFDDFTNEQIGKFQQAVEIFRAKNFCPTWYDLANSPATLAHEKSWGNLVRIGGALYGIGKDIFPPSETVDFLRPVMSLKSKICLLKRVPRGETLGYSRSFAAARDSLIATVPIGYNDGLPRLLSNKGRAIVNGHFAFVVGRVSMDLTILDVTDAPQVEINDEVIFVGSQNGKSISAEDIARQSDTISYDITCGISKRVPRRFND